jgi:fructose-bisphosphate aldolase class II
MTKTILDISYSELKEKNFLTFDQLWEIVDKELSASWIEVFPNLDEKNIKKKKKGELYKLLCIDGRFIKNKEDQWSLIEKYTFDEVQKLKAFVKEELD